MACEQMKQLTSDSQDATTLQTLGRASVQIVHDLKNQLNGLKLYATFLRKRMEKSERPADEQETIGKLISGLERAATDMTVLVRYGRPIELRRQPHTNLVKIMNTVLMAEQQDAAVRFEPEADLLTGDFDTAALAEALQTITANAIIANALGTRSTQNDSADSIVVGLRREQAEAVAPQIVIEWRGVSAAEGDPFHSFAGSNGLRMSLAAKIIEAHGGETEAEADIWRVRLPLMLE